MAARISAIQPRMAAGSPSIAPRERSVRSASRVWCASLRSSQAACCAEKARRCAEFLSSTARRHGLTSRTIPPGSRSDGRSGRRSEKGTGR